MKSIHTNHGLYSTLYSFPTIMMRNAMRGSVISIYSRLPTILKNNGYYNLFFIPHESQYDNMNAFFRTNRFDKNYTKKNYPKGKIEDQIVEYTDWSIRKFMTETHKQPWFDNTLFISVGDHGKLVGTSENKINLLKEQHLCIFYTTNNLIAVQDSAYLYIHFLETRQEFRYTLKDGKLQLSDDNHTFQALKEYCFSMLQSTEYLVKQGKTVSYPPSNPL